LPFIPVCAIGHFCPTQPVTPYGNLCVVTWHASCDVAHAVCGLVLRSYCMPPTAVGWSIRQQMGMLSLWLCVPQLVRFGACACARATRHLAYLPYQTCTLCGAHLFVPCLMHAVHICLPFYMQLFIHAAVVGLLFLDAQSIHMCLGGPLAPWFRVDVRLGLRSRVLHTGGGLLACGYSAEGFVGPCRCGFISWAVDV
jgi:hypothetical protein